MAQGTPLRLTLIGCFALWRGTQELPIAGSGQRLIALLALRDHPVGRVQAASTLWPDYPQDRALAALRTALWRVNRTGGQVIVASPAALRLHAAIDVDVRHLVALARRLARPGVAMGIGGPDSVGMAELVGDLLPDWYDDWLQDEREGLRQTRLHALESLARQLSESGYYADAIQAALAAIRLEPLRESAHRALSRCTWPRATCQRRGVSSSGAAGCCGRNSASDRPIRCACSSNRPLATHGRDRFPLDQAPP